MKKLFIVLCDVMAVAAVIAAVSLVGWIFTAAFGQETAGAMKTVCIGASIVAAVATVAAFIAWKNGGAPGSGGPNNGEGGE